MMNLQWSKHVANLHNELVVFDVCCFIILRKTNELITPTLLMFCFSEHHLKHTQINYIPIDNCTLGAENCTRFIEGVPVCMFIHKALKFLINLRASDVWLTVHRNSVWIRKTN